MNVEVITSERIETIDKKPTLDEATQNLKIHWSISTTAKSDALSPRIEERIIPTESLSSQNLDRLKEAQSHKLDASSGKGEATDEKKSWRTFAAKRTPWEKSSRKRSMEKWKPRSHRE